MQTIQIQRTMKKLWLTSFFAALALAAPTGQAAKYTVTNSSNDGVGSLRAAVASAAGTPGADTIVFDPTLNGTTITLMSEIAYDAGGDLDIDASHLPNGVTVDGGPGGNRIFSFHQAVTIRNLKLVAGDGTGALGDGSGGAIYTDSALTLKYCTLSGNSAAAAGGAIASASGVLLLENCALFGNAVAAVGAQGGGAIFTAGDVTLVNCTLTGNFAPKGGAILFDGGSTRRCELIHCTAAKNLAGGESAGGIELTGSGSLRLVNTIVAGNTAGLGRGNKQDLTIPSAAQLSLDGQNILQTVPANFDEIALATYTGHLLVADPKLQPLDRQGGPTQTMALRTGSPAIDGGRAASVALPTRDQRGYPRVRGPWSDIGAFESDTFQFAVTEFFITVDTATDELDPYGTDGTGISLREAIRDAKTDATIFFSRPVFATNRTIHLDPALGPIELKRNVKIDARPAVNFVPGEYLTLDATGGGHRILAIPPPVNGRYLTSVDLFGLALAGGANATDPSGGGGVQNSGVLRMVSCRVSDCTSRYEGGGVANYQFLIVNRCLFETNTANDTDLSTASTGGGAIANHGGLIVRQCIFSHNTAATGGAIDHRTLIGVIPDTSSQESMKVIHSTFLNNQAGVAGGAIYAPVPWTLQYSVFADNARGLGATRDEVTTIDTRTEGLSDLGLIGNSFLFTRLLNLDGQPFNRGAVKVGDPKIGHAYLFTPDPGSPAINQNPTREFTTDIFGNPAIGPTDAGAKESVSFTPVGAFRIQLTGSAPKSNATVDVRVTGTGALTGSAMVAGPDATNGFMTLVFKFKSQIDPVSRIATIPLDARGIALTLKLTLNADGTITADLTGADGRVGQSAPTFAFPARGKLRVPAGMVGRYSVAIGDLATAPPLSYGTLTVDRMARVKFIGVLPDRTKVAFGSAMDRTYRFAARVPIAHMLGYFAMNAQIDPEGIATAGFAFSIRPTDTATIFKPGTGGFFLTDQNVSLHRYLPPLPDQQVTNSFALSAGAGFCGHTISGSSGPASAFQLTTKPKALSNVPGFKLYLSRTTGLFTGTVPATAPGTKPSPFGGVIFQTYALPAGFGIGYGLSHEGGATHSIYLFSKDLATP